MLQFKKKKKKKSPTWKIKHLGYFMLWPVL